MNVTIALPADLTAGEVKDIIRDVLEPRSRRPTPRSDDWSWRERRVAMETTRPALEKVPDDLLVVATYLRTGNRLARALADLRGRPVPDNVDEADAGRLVRILASYP